MDKVYVIQFNDGFLVDEAYISFEDAQDVCKDMLGKAPKQVDIIIEIEPMKYIKIVELGVA